VTLFRCSLGRSHKTRLTVLTFKERQLYKSGVLNLDLQSAIMSTSCRKTLSKRKPKNFKKSSPARKFKKTLAPNPSKCKAENSEKSSSAKKFKKTLAQNPSKCKAENSEESLPAKKFKQTLSQKLFDWYKLDDKGLWHCETCRSSKLTNAYAKGHQVRAKTTNHVRHAKCKLYFLYYFFLS